MAEEVEDEAVVDSWEDFEENPDVLDQQLKKMSIKNEKSLEKVGETLMLSEDDNQRSNPFNSQEPKIMILRRPQKSSVELPNGVVIQKQKPVKSLQQRQAEYAEARLRILGDSGSPTTEEVKIKPLQHKLQDQWTCDSSGFVVQGNPANNVYLPENTPSSISVSGGSKTIAFIKPSPSSVNVVRAPRGPSSQIGFQHRSGSNHPS